MNKNIVFIGGGNMARSLIGGLTANHYPTDKIWVADPAASQLEGIARDFGVNTTVDNKAAAERADVIVFAVKPQVIASVATNVADAVQKNRPLILSVVAGIMAEDISYWLGDDVAIVRTMPNSPALHGCGVTALYANNPVGEEDRQTAAAIMQGVGRIIWVDAESLMHAVTAVSGSGPAYFFLLMEVVEQTATRLGLAPEAARTLTVETAYGAARMARDDDVTVTLDELRRRVTSGGGTTEAALEVLQNGDFRELVERAVTAACNRSVALSQEFGKH